MTRFLIPALPALVTEPSWAHCLLQPLRQGELNTCSCFHKVRPTGRELTQTALCSGPSSSELHPCKLSSRA